MCGRFLNKLPAAEIARKVLRNPITDEQLVQEVRFALAS
jgi:hypothetical protein